MGRGQKGLLTKLYVMAMEGRKGVVGEKELKDVSWVAAESRDKWHVGFKDMRVNGHKRMVKWVNKWERGRRICARGS